MHNLFYFCTCHNVQNNVSIHFFLTGTDLITIQASDKDSYYQYKQIQLKIVSINPKPHDLEFDLKSRSDGAIGVISFKGCLDHEVRGLTVYDQLRY